MGRLLALLGDYRHLLYYFLLLGIALGLLSSYSQPHQALTHRLSLRLSGDVLAARRGIYSYLNLRAENEALQRQNIALSQQLLAARSELNTYKYRSPYRYGFTVLPDSVIPRPQWRFLQGRVIQNTITSQYNYLTLDIGAAQGVVKEMGLVSPTGVAGVVVAVGEHYSLAMSVLNKNLKLYAKIKDRDIYGTLTWSGGDYSRGKLAYIPQHFRLQPGDTVVTSGYGSIFPEGTYIGTIDAIEPDPQGSFYDISLRLGTDFFRLDNVYLIQRRDKARIDSLARLGPRTAGRSQR